MAKAKKNKQAQKEVEETVMVVLPKGKRRFMKRSEWESMHAELEAERAKR